MIKTLSQLLLLLIPVLIISCNNDNIDELAPKDYTLLKLGLISSSVEIVNEEISNLLSEITVEYDSTDDHKNKLDTLVAHLDKQDWVSADLLLYIDEFSFFTASEILLQLDSLGHNVSRILELKEDINQKLYVSNVYTIPAELNPLQVEENCLPCYLKNIDEGIFYDIPHIKIYVDSVDQETQKVFTSYESYFISGYLKNATIYKENGDVDVFIENLYDEDNPQLCPPLTKQQLSISNLSDTSDINFYIKYLGSDKFYLENELKFTFNDNGFSYSISQN